MSMFEFHTLFLFVADVQKFRNVPHPLFLEYGPYEDSFIIISYVPTQ